MRALEHAGASVHLLQADVADEEQLRAALAAYRDEGWPAIRGVIHAAAVLDSHLTNDMDRAAFERVMAPKLAGALNLDRLLPDLDLFVVFSSISAFWAPPGMANYSAANAGLDAVAERRRARGQHAVSIQWGPWAGVGLHEAVISERSTQEMKRTGVGSIAIETGTSLFAAIARETGAGDHRAADRLADIPSRASRARLAVVPGAVRGRGHLLRTAALRRG